MLNGKLSAIRWMLGDEWDMLVRKRSAGRTAHIRGGSCPPEILNKARQHLLQSRPNVTKASGRTSNAARSSARKASENNAKKAAPAHKRNPLSKSAREFTLRDLVRIQIPVFDEFLAERNVALSIRPYRATEMLLKHCLTPVDDGWKIPKATDLEFGAFYYPVLAWYTQKHGRAFGGPKHLDEDLVGIALCKGELTEVRVPKVVNSGRDDAHVYLQFPLALRPEENPLAFLRPRPRLALIRGKQRIQFVAQVTEVVNVLRRIFNLLLGLDDDKPQISELRDALLQQLKSTAVRAVEGRSVALAMFDLRMSCEIAVKLHLSQQHGKFEPIHNFDRLLGESSAEVRDLADRLMPAELRSYAVHNASRYGSKAKAAVSTARFFEIYKSGLTFLEELLRLLKRKVVFNNATLTMRQLPWALRGPSFFGYPEL